MRNVVTVHTGPIRIHLNVSPWAGWTKDCQEIDRASRLRRKYVGTCSTTGCGHAGCSKSSSSKAAASEGPEAYPPHFVGPFAIRMDLGERKSPYSASGLREALPQR